MATAPAFLCVHAQRAASGLAKGWRSLAEVSEGRLQLRLVQGLVHFPFSDFLPFFLCTWQCFLLAVSKPVRENVCTLCQPLELLLCVWSLFACGIWGCLYSRQQWFPYSCSCLLPLLLAFPKVSPGGFEPQEGRGEFSVLFLKSGVLDFPPPFSSTA